MRRGANPRCDLVSLGNVHLSEFSGSALSLAEPVNSPRGQLCVSLSLLKAVSEEDNDGFQT